MIVRIIQPERDFRLPSAPRELRLEIPLGNAGELHRKLLCGPQTNFSQELALRIREEIGPEAAFAPDRA